MSLCLLRLYISTETQKTWKRRTCRFPDEERASKRHEMIGATGLGVQGFSTSRA